MTAELPDEEMKEGVSEYDYAVMMKDILLRLRDSVRDNPNATNLVNTALDYMFYLEDNRRVII